MRGRSRGFALFVSVAMTASLATPAGAATTPAAAPPAVTTPQAAARSEVVTLVTGDIVHLTTYRDGRQTAAVRGGPASGSLGFQTVHERGHTLVIPEIAWPYVQSGRLDRALFDVTALAAQGYDDMGALPLILQYAGDPAKSRPLLAQPPPAGAGARRTLASVGAVAVSVPKADVTRFWEAIDDDRTTAAAMRAPVLGHHLSKVWLDARVTASLDVSVPQIGAPAAWQAGFDGTGVTVAVLDTGIDPNHVDVAGQVTATANFSTAPDATDKNGHGTHVASTIAGTGAASGGRYRGVAPGAKLVVGKVLGNDGTGGVSEIIAGMEWAAARAKVVNMSLGSPSPSDGTDPLSQAADRLTAAHGTLFVVAAGNSGPWAESIGSPAAADSALTVGAVNRADVLARFSTRGPRPGNHAVKPDIVAPGVDIVAARATGTLPDQAIDERHAKLSGTSMATPHVAGAAALLVQQHPGWAPERIKALLTSTAKPIADATVYEQGAGRADVARAVRQRVTASTGVLSMGRWIGPYGTVEPARRTVTYQNDGLAPVTLDLAVTARNADGLDATADMLAVSPSRLTVPAGGTANATVTVDPNRGERGLYGGQLTARAGEDVLSTALGFDKDLLHTATVKALARNGRAPMWTSTLYLWNLDTGLNYSLMLKDGVATAQVRPGKYMVWSTLATADATGRHATELTAVVKPEVTVAGDTEIAVDARGGKPVTVNTPQLTAPQTMAHSIHRKVGARAISHAHITGGLVTKLFAVPSEPAERGELEYLAHLQLEAPELTMAATAPPFTLSPVYLTPADRVAKRLDGTRTLPAVFVGDGRPEDFAGRDVRGKIALVRYTSLPIPDVVTAAATAKAAMVVVLADRPGGFAPSVPSSVPLPTVGLPHDQGAELLRRLERGPLRLKMVGTVASPYRYEVVLPYPGRIPDELVHTPDSTNTATQTTLLHAVRPGQWGGYAVTMSRPVNSIGFAQVLHRPFPLRQERHFSANGTQYGQHVYADFPYDNMVVLRESMRPGTAQTKSWFKAPIAPGLASARPPTARSGDRFLFTFDAFTDSEPDHALAYPPLKSTARVYRDGELVGKSPTGVGYFDVGVAQPATYRVELDVAEGRPGWVLSQESRSAWTFRSSRPAGTGWSPLPVIAARWSLNVDLANTAPAGRPFALRLAAATQHSAPAAAVRSARAWISYDDGGTWRRVDLARDGGQFTGRVTHPKLADTTGFAALRYEITDANGGRVEQTLLRAYMLR